MKDRQLKIENRTLKIEHGFSFSHYLPTANG